MRFRLNLEITGISRELPINYQYELSSWIFHVINYSNTDFARWLHDTGYCYGYKKFKLFTFSRLKPEKYTISGDRLVIESRNSELVISFFMQPAVEHFIEGLFRNQQFRLGDRFSSVDFHVSQIETLPDIDFSSRMNFRALSPIIISHNKLTEKYAQYLSPEDELYPELFYNNLINKYVALAEFNNESLNKTAALIEPDFKFSLIGRARQKLIRVKTGRSDETYLKGYEFDFSLTAPVELIKIGYFAGFGEKNSLGFGCVEEIKFT